MIIQASKQESIQNIQVNLQVFTNSNQILKAFNEEIEEALQEYLSAIKEALTNSVYQLVANFFFLLFYECLGYW